jgi:S1-C subfamily serine protease
MRPLLVSEFAVRRRWLLAVLVTFICSSAFAADIPSLVRKAKPAVVQLLGYDQDGELVASGTGFFISPDGKLLTNSHLLEGKVYSFEAKTITGQIYSNWRILSVPQEDNHPIEEDVAQIQFFDAKDVPYLSLGSSKDLVEGQRVLVIGNPEGLTGTVSDGLIAAFRKKGAVIQITAPISHGSSGSPVLDESGNVIGIATAGREDGQNLNFAISADAVRDATTKSHSPATAHSPVTARVERRHAVATPTTG